MSAADRRPLDLADVAAMVDVIPAVDRDVWLRTAMAIKAEFGDAGFETWDAWSQTAGNYIAADAAAVWRSITDGPVTIATLVHLAREHGWIGGHAVSPKNLPASLRQSQPQANHSHVNNSGRPGNSVPVRNTGLRTYGLELWLRAIRDDVIVAKHPYLQRKQFTAAHGAGVADDVRCRLWEGPQTCLVIPIREHGTGKVIAVQAINADGTKCTFGSMSSEADTPGYLVLGNTLDPEAPLFVCEGFADIVSLVFYVYGGDACGAIAFGKGRLEKVAEQFSTDMGRRSLIIGDRP